MSLSGAGSVSGTFGAAAANSYGAGGIAAGVNLTQTVLVQPAPVSLLDALSFHRPEKEQAPQQVPEARLRAATQNTSGMWKAADTVRPDAVLKGAEGFSSKHADPKAQAADIKQSHQIAEIKGALKDMAALGVGPLAQAPGGGGVSGAGMAKSFAADALVTTGMTLAMGPVGGIVATGLLAAKAGLQGSSLEGQGTLVTFNKGIDYSAPMPALRGSKQDSRSARSSDYGYGASSSSPAQTGAGAAPVSNALQQAMSKGPGFGRADVLGDLNPRMKLSEDSLDQIAIKIADDSPAGKAIKDMREDSKYAKTVLQKQSKGIDATADNVADAANLGLDVTAQTPKIQTFKMA